MAKKNHLPPFDGHSRWFILSRGGIHSTHRKTHTLAADEVDVQVVDNLAAVRAGVDDEPVTCLRDTELFGDFLRGQEQMPGYAFIGCFKVVDRCDVFIRDDEEVMGCNRVDVPKSGDDVIAIIDITRGVTRDDSTKDTS